MRLRAIDSNKEQVWNKHIERRPADDWREDGEGDADLPRQWVRQQTRKSGGEVEMPGHDAPAGRVVVDDVVEKAGEFGPEERRG